MGRRRPQQSQQIALLFSFEPRIAQWACRHTKLRDLPVRSGQRAEWREERSHWNACGVFAHYGSCESLVNGFAVFAALCTNGTHLSFFHVDVRREDCVDGVDLKKLCNV